MEGDAGESATSDMIDEIKIAVDGNAREFKSRKPTQEYIATSWTEASRNRLYMLKSYKSTFSGKWSYVQVSPSLRK